MGSGGESGMGDLFFKKHYPADCFRGKKNLARKYLGKKISCPEKNISHHWETISTNRLLPSWRIMMLGKNLTPLYVGETILSQSKF